MATPNLNEHVIKLSQASTQPIAHYSFIERGTIAINNINIPEFIVGDIGYQNRVIECDGAIKIKNWIFVLESNKLSQTIAIGGFLRNIHYLFLNIREQIPLDLQRGREILINFVLTKIGPILMNNLYQKLFKVETTSVMEPNDIKFSWEIIKNANNKLWTPEELEYYSTNE